MKVKSQRAGKTRIEMIPLIDLIFLLLVYFIYGMFSMALHRGVPVLLPTSTTAAIEKALLLSVTIRSDGTVFLDKEKVLIQDLGSRLKERAERDKKLGLLLFAERDLPYQKLYDILDEIRTAGITNVSLQAAGKPH